MVTVAILAVLSAVAIPQIRMFLVRADRTEAALYLDAVAKAQYSYRATADTFYPACAAGNVAVSCPVSPVTSPNTLDVNEFLGLGRIDTTPRGWKFSWDYTGGGWNLDTSYVLIGQKNSSIAFIVYMTKDMDNKPGEDALFIPPYAVGTNDKDWMEYQSCDPPVFTSRPCGLPYLNRDDMLN